MTDKKASSKKTTQKKEETTAAVAVVVFDSFTILREELEQAATDYSGLVVTNENYKDCLKARERLRELRYGIQNQQKANHAKRVEWNKKMLNANDAKAEELIALIFPTEETLDAQIKAIEAVNKKEKAEKAAAAKLIFDTRFNRIKATGALANNVEGLILTHGDIELYISTEELEKFNDQVFESVAVKFETLAKEIEAAAAEAQKLIERTNVRTKQLYSLGFAFDGTGYVSSRVEQKLSVDYIKEVSENIWLEEIHKIECEIAIYEAKQAEAKEEQKKQELKEKEEREAIKKQQDEIAAQQEEIKREKALLLEARTESRVWLLRAIGMTLKATSECYVFEGEERFAEISVAQITNLSSDEFNTKHESLKKEIAGIKAEDERIASIRKAAAVYRERNEKLLSLGFVLDGSNLTRGDVSYYWEYIQDCGEEEFQEIVDTITAIVAKETAARKEAMKSENERILNFINSFVPGSIVHDDLSDHGRSIVTHIERLYSDFKTAALELVDHD